jgi:hypothetical protein
MRKGRRSKSKKRTKKAVLDTRIWVCDTQNRVYYDARTTLTPEQFNSSYGHPKNTRSFIQTMLPQIPHSGEWILRLLYLPKSYNSQPIKPGTPIYDPDITYVGISVIHISKI